MDYKLLNLKVNGDERGKLISLEGGKSVPFEIKRVYWIFDTLPDSDRGFHAHKSLEQIIVAMDGACEFVLDDGVSREKVLLNRPDVGLYIGKNMWREMRHFSYGCKLMVLASEYYDEGEYIREYAEFKANLSANGNSQNQNLVKNSVDFTSAAKNEGFALADIAGGGGQLNALKLPFTPSRVFYIFDTKGDVVRGNHANKESQFVMFCVKGSCKVRVDDGVRKSEVVLSAQNGTPQNALWLDKMIWKEMFDFSHDAVLVVLASTLYDESEYIRDYEAFAQSRGAL